MAIIIYAFEVVYKKIRIQTVYKVTLRKLNHG